jgi:hypothetical protein
LTTNKKERLFKKLKREKERKKGRKEEMKKGKHSVRER